MVTAENIVVAFFGADFLVGYKKSVPFYTTGDLTLNTHLMDHWATSPLMNKDNETGHPGFKKWLLQNINNLPLDV